MKKSEIFIVTEENTVLVFHTKNFDIFEKSLREDQVEMESQNYSENLEVRMITGRKKVEALQGATEEDLALLQGRNLSYADTFLY